MTKGKRASKADGGGGGADGGPKRRRSARSRLIRWGVRGAVALVLLVGVALVVLRETSLLETLVERKLSSAYGVQVDIGDVRFNLGHRIDATDVTVEMPGLPGEAGELLTIDEASVWIDRSRLLGGTLPLTRVQLRGVLARMSVDEELRPNFADVRTPPSGGGTLPRIELVGVTLELGEHDASGYRTLSTMPLQASVRPAGGSSYEIELLERMVPGAAGPGDQRLTLRGTTDRDTGEIDLTLTGLDFAEWSRKRAPHGLRGLWNTLDVRGSVPRATFEYSRGGGVRTEVTLDGVGMNLPVRTADAMGALAAGAGGSPDAEDLLTMQSVTGTLVFDSSGARAELDGIVEELPATVTLTMDGYAVDAPMELVIDAHEFKLLGGRGLLRFAPPDAVNLYERFASPVGTLSGRVSMRREQPGEEMVVDGYVDIAGADGAFEEFPYPIRDLSGRIAFDRRNVEVIDFEAIGPTGARIVASGKVGPLGNGAAVRIDVTARGVPSDEVFRGSLSPDRREIYDAVFDSTELSRLIADGYVITPERASELAAAIERAEAGLAGLEGAVREVAEAELAELRAEANLPVFELGGLAELDVRIRRPEGPDEDYETTVDMRFPRAGVLIDRFPYPVRVEGLRLLIEPGVVTVSTEELAGLTGGRGGVDGRIRFELGESGYDPDLTVLAEGVPVDRYLIQALPGDPGEAESFADADNDALASDGVLGGDVLGETFSVRRFLTRLNIDGAVTTRAEILGAPEARERGLPLAEVADGDGTPDGGAGEAGVEAGLSYDIAVTFEDVSAQPGDGRTRVEAVTGNVRVTPGRVVVSPMTGRIGQSSWEAELTAVLGGAAGGAAAGADEPAFVRGTLLAEGLDLSRPVEAYLAAVSPDNARVLEELRRLYNPRGLIDAAISLDTSAPAAEAWRVELGSAAYVAFEGWGGDVRLDSPTGRVTVTPEVARVRGFGGPATYEFEPLGKLTVDGELPTVFATPSEMTVLLEAARFSSAFTRAVTEEAAPAAEEWMRAVGLDGVYDATVRRRWDSERVVTTDAVVRPKSIALTRRGRRVVLPETSGSFEVLAGGGGAVDVRGRGDGFSGHFAGEWFLPTFAGAGVGIEGVLSLEAQGMPEELMAVVPPAVEEAAVAMELAFDGAVRIEGGELTLARPKGDAASDDAVETVHSGFRGVVAFERVDLLVGMEVTAEDGRALVNATVPVARRDGGEALGAADWRVDVRAAGARALDGVPMTNLVAVAHGGERVGSAVLPVIEAQCFGGKVTASAALLPDSGRGALFGRPGANEFRLRAAADGVAFGELLGVWLPGEPGAQAGGGSAGDGPAVDRGELTADLTLEGVVAAPESRLGRATVRVRAAPGSEGTEILRLPGVTTIVQLSNLQLPTNEPLDFGYADAFIRGSTLHLRDVSLESGHRQEMSSPTDRRGGSNAVAVIGAGTVTWPDLDLDLRFTASLLGRRPFWTQLVDAVRNEIALVRVRGTVAEPEISLQQFEATREFLESIISGEPTRGPRPVSPVTR